MMHTNDGLLNPNFYLEVPVDILDPIKTDSWKESIDEHVEQVRGVMAKAMANLDKYASVFDLDGTDRF